MIEEKEINSVVRSLLKQKRKNKLFKAFVASKRGGNNKGDGRNRSVILATRDGKIWYQFYKIWGDKNEAIASEIIKRFKSI